MRFARSATLAVLATLAASGCRTAGVDNLARRDPAVPRPAIDARAVIAEHNRNAERVQSLEASPSLTVYAGRRSLGVDGKLALERPRRFSLTVRHTSGEVADIGSNDDKFWFWVKDNKDKAVYYCNHEDVGASPLAAALQPDWIVEALGLRVIPEEEAGDFSLGRGQSPDTLVLTHKPTKTGGETVIRMTVISEATHRIKEHRLYAADGKTLLAKAAVEHYMKVEPSGRPEDAVYLPQKLKLEWIREQLSMAATFSQDTTQVNVDFSERPALFVEQKRTGYDRLNLAAGRLPRDTGSGIRETRPAPPAGIELGEPAPFGVDGAFRTERDPLALSEDMPRRPSLKEQLVPPAMPRAPELKFAKPSTASGWRAASSSAFERER